MVEASQSKPDPEGRDLVFTLKNADLQEKLEFVPYFSQHGCRGGIYFYLLEPDSPAFTQHLIRKKMQQREYRCEVDSLPIGNDQYELLHQVAGEHTHAGSDYFENFRAAEQGGWFTYEMKRSQKPCFLRFLVLAKEGIRNLDYHRPRTAPFHPDAAKQGRGGLCHLLLSSAGNPYHRKRLSHLPLCSCARHILPDLRAAGGVGIL